MDSLKTLLIQNRGSLRIVVFNNPLKKNSFTDTAYTEIRNVLNEAASDESVNVVALTGAGDFYSSGNDISSGFPSGSGNIQEHMAKRTNNVSEFINAFINFPKLLVAVVNGPAIGIAATTLALCDVVYAADTSYFYTPFTKLGLCSEGCSSYTFPKILGKSKANEMLLLNHKMNAEEALRFNFISEIFSHSELDTKIWPKIESFTTLSKESLRVCKRLNLQAEIDNLRKATKAETEELDKRLVSEDFINSLIEFSTRKSKL